MMSAFDLTDRPPAVTVPVLLVVGDADGCHGPEVFAATAGGLPDARLVVHPRTGHAGVQRRRELTSSASSAVRPRATPMPTCPPTSGADLRPDRPRPVG